MKTTQKTEQPLVCTQEIAVKAKLQLEALHLVRALLKLGELQLVAEHTGGHAPGSGDGYPDPVDTAVGIPTVREAAEYLSAMDLGSLIENALGAFAAAAESRMHRRYRGAGCPQSCLDDVCWSVCDGLGRSAGEALKGLLFSDDADDE